MTNILRIIIKVVAVLYLVGITSAVQSAGGSSDYSSGGKKKENEAYSMSSDGRFGDVQLLISQKNYEIAER